MLATRLEHQYPWPTRRPLMRIEDLLIPAEPFVLHEDLPALPSVVGADIEIPRHVAWFVLAR